MKWLIIIPVILLLGPLRRPYFSHAVITIPMTIGAVAGTMLGLYIASNAHMSPVAAIGLVFAMALGLATGLSEASKDWFDRNLGKKD